MYKEGRFNNLIKDSSQRYEFFDIKKTEMIDARDNINNSIDFQVSVRKVSLDDDDVMIKIDLSDNEEAIDEIIDVRWSDLTFQSKMHLLHSSISFCSVQNEHGGFDEDDTFVGSTELINYCAGNESNFFLHSYAQSFLVESHRKEASTERKRIVVSKLWSSSVSYATENNIYDPETVRGEQLTMFGTTELTSITLPRHVDGPEDLTDEECNKIYDRLVSDKEFLYDVYFSKHLLEAEEWTDAHRDSDFENAFLPDSVQNLLFSAENYWEVHDAGDFRFSVCKLSSDTRGLYRDFTGEMVDLFHDVALPEIAPDVDACALFRDIDGLISSISLDGVSITVEGLQYSEILKTYPRLLEQLPSDVFDMLLSYCEKYEIFEAKIDDYEKQTSTFNTANNSPYGSEYSYSQVRKSSQVKEDLQTLEIEYDLLISALKNWGKETLATRTIPQTPFCDLMPNTVDAKQALIDESTYKIFTSMRMRESMERYFGFSYVDLTTRNQLQLINFLTRNNTDRVDRVRDFTKLYGTNGLRTFLALERSDETFGDHIVTFGQRSDVAGSVFKYYGELLNSADRAEALVKEVANCEGNTCVELADQVRENILNRAQKDLEKAVRSNNPDEIAEQVETYVAEAKEYVALLQEVGAGKIENIPSGEVTTVEQERMRNLLQANYRKAYPELESGDFKRAVAGSLDKSFHNPSTTFRVLRDRDRIVSYNRFDILQDYTGREVSYFGSFNADPAYSGVGGIMLEQTIKDELESGRSMMAHCDPTQAITKKYIEDGFVATAYYSLAGKPSFEIWRSNDSSTQLESKDKTFDDLIGLANASKNIIVRTQAEQETYLELQYGNVLTRYFTHQGKTFLVFEKIPEKLRSDFTPPQQELKKAA